VVVAGGWLVVVVGGWPVVVVAGAVVAGVVVPPFGPHPATDTADRTRVRNIATTQCILGIAANDGIQVSFLPVNNGTGLKLMLKE